MTRLVDLSMPVHRGMVTFPRIPPPSLLMYETWHALSAAPAGALRELGIDSYLTMIYETAWHEENELDYSNDCYGPWFHPDGSWEYRYPVQLVMGLLGPKLEGFRQHWNAELVRHEGATFVFRVSTAETARRWFWQRSPAQPPKFRRQSFCSASISRRSTASTY